MKKVLYLLPLILLLALSAFGGSYVYHQDTWVEELLGIARIGLAFLIMVGLPIIAVGLLILIFKVLKYGFSIIKNFFIHYS
jgi:hypothetical protein